MDVQKLVDDKRQKLLDEIDSLLPPLQDLKKVLEKKNNQFAIAHVDGKISAYKAVRILVDDIIKY